MKRFLLFLIFVFTYLNTCGQNTYIGRIISMPDTRIYPLTRPFSAYGLTTVSGTYLLTLDSLPISSLIIEDTEYSEEEIVIITGTTRVRPGTSLGEYYELEIETIERSVYNQDIQRFLGTYAIEGMCVRKDSPQYPIQLQGKIILAEGRYNDLYFFMTTLPINSLHIYVENDSLFIPIQWRSVYPSSTNALSMGKGKIENDSIFFYNVFGDYFYGYPDPEDSLLITCDWKGKKISFFNSILDSIRVIPPVPSVNDEILFATYLKPFSGDCTYELNIDSIVDYAIYISGKYNGNARCITENGRNDTLSISSYQALEKGMYSIIYSLMDTNGLISAEVSSTDFEVHEATGIGISNSDKNKVYVDATRQVIVIDETLQNQSFTFELVDLPGNTILKKTNTDESVSIANLPSGIYLCRILQNGQIIYSDKILKY